MNRISTMFKGESSGNGAAKGECGIRTQTHTHIHTGACTQVHVTWTGAATSTQLAPMDANSLQVYVCVCERE